MNPESLSVETIDQYISAAAPSVRPILKRIRATVRKAAPQAVERISYRMPAFFQDGVVIYFAAFKHHIGIYPPPRDPKLNRAASRYAGEKGNLRLLLDTPIPYRLISQIAKARVRENLAKAAQKRRRKTSS